MPRRPDFLIIGAMRAGTTTVHHALASHPRVFLPDAELFFFDADDFDEHAEAFRAPDGSWRPLDFDADFDTLEAAWLANFAEARPDQIVGEDSTTYLSSALAPARVARYLPKARLIVSLRDPVERTWSHYWHLVRSGRMTMRFEDALLNQRETMLHRSRYAPALRRWLAQVPAERLHVEVFEELVDDLDAGLERLGAFLDLVPPLSEVDLDGGDRHRHQGRVPRSLSLQLAANWARRQAVLGQDLPTVAAPTRKTGRPWLARTLDRLAGTETVIGTPPLRDDTRQLLQHLLGRDNAGLAELIGQSLRPWWPWFPE